MATSFKMEYVSPDVAVTITLASLASSLTAGRESTVVSNTTNLDLDHQLMAFFTPQAGTPANDKGVYVRGYGTAGTTVYPDNVTGADAALTPTSESNLTWIGFVNIVTTATRGGSFLGSVATVFGSMPEKIGYWARNYCGFALSATGSASGLTYNRVRTQGV